MENTPEMLELLKQIEKTNRQQVRAGRLQCLLSLIAAVCCAAVLLTVGNLLPQVSGVIDQAQTVLGNLEQTTAQLAAVDLEGMVTNVDTLVNSGQESLEQTMEKLESIDFEALNKAIDDLSAVVEPMAKFFQAFR